MKGRLVATFLTVFFSASICCAQNFDPTQNGIASHGNALNFGHASEIAGVVIGPDGAPIGDVRIEIRNEQTGSIVASGYTNAAGVFQFNNLPTAPYDLVATRGLAESHEHLALADVAINLKVRLNTAEAEAAHAEGRSVVSVAEYKVPQKARDAFHKAEAAMVKGNRDELVKHLARSLEIYPAYAAALTLRGVLLLDGNKPEAAVEDFDKAIHSDPAFARAYTAMAAAFNQLKRFDEAIGSADRAVTLAPKSWQSYFEMAKSYIGKADYAHALQQLSKAQQLTPTEYAPFHLVRAHVMLALKDYSSAMNELQAFLTLAPQDPNSGAARQALEKVKAFTAAADKPPIVNAVR